MKTPITYYGGKQLMLKHLLPLIPEHSLYCEPFFGGGALFFAKEPSLIEVINDLNGEVVNFYRVVQLDFESLQKEISVTLHSRHLFSKAKVVYENPEMFSEVKRAWAFWCLANQGFASTLTSWGAGKDDSKSKSLDAKRDGFCSYYAERLKKVQVEANDALKVIDRCDSTESFFYVDPPYFNSNMGHYAGYDKFHYELLLEKLSKIKGKFLLSSYPSDELSKYIELNDWYSESIEKPIAVTKHTKKTKTEVMVCNYCLPV